MHELAVCGALIEQVERVAREQQARSVELIGIAIGPLSGVEPQLLEQAYPLATAGTLAEGATLEIEDMPVRVHCKACGQDSDAAANRLVCAHCGNWRTSLLSGDELLLTRVEIIRESVDV
ncbi:MAG: hydrogenase maturation nickel metallochaperone HypA [Thiogranum sp.]|jgi:hydrogenase nickel incorporation protein HypA/HybF